VRFEVASIRSNKSESGFIMFGCHGTDSKFSGAFGIEPPPLGRCVARRATLKSLIGEAYNLRGPDADKMISAGPNWLETDRFDVEAKAPEPATEGELHLMLQALLAERFQLKMHRSPKERGGCALVIAKGGPKLKASPAQEERKGLWRLNGGPLVGQAASMSQLAKTLSGPVGRPVTDETGLGGTYDFTLRWTPDESEPDWLAALPPEVRAQLPPREAPTGPSIFTALQEQLGLKLETRKVTIETLVIDHVERPSEN
jgi:uncharacterized protein (TIGR03435 family)